MPEAAQIYYDEAIISHALDNFMALIDEMDYDYFLSKMAIGRFQFLLRKQMRLELCAMFIALWRLALAHSFPRVADAMFDEFLDRYTAAHSGKTSEKIRERASQYWGMIEPCGDSDFNVAARHLTSFLIKDESDVRPLTLKLALGIRLSYRFIFERLI